MGWAASSANMRLAVGLGLILLAALVEDSMFQVKATESALVLRLGAPVRVLNQPGEAGAGLHLKWPLIEQVARYDRRVQTLDLEPLAVTTTDHRAKVASAFVQYRIADPWTFFERLKGEPDALSVALAAPLRQTLSAATARTLDQGAPSMVPLQAAAGELGVQVLGLGLSQLDPAPADTLNMIHNMQSAETAEAASIRSVGDQKKQDIMADADQAASHIRAAALAQSEAIWGDADAQRAAIFAEAYGRNPTFAHFYQALRSYEAALNDKNATLVMSPDSAFFDVWRKGAAGK